MKWEIIEDVVETGTYRYEVEADSYLEALEKVKSGDAEIIERDMVVSSSRIQSCEKEEV